MGSEVGVTFFITTKLYCISTTLFKDAGDWWPTLAIYYSLL